MIIYRPHRGTLIDSMMEAKEFETLEKMKDFIKEDIIPIKIKKKDIVLSKKTHDDDRINWKNVHFVCIKGYRNPQCIGMCSNNYKF